MTIPTRFLTAATVLLAASTGRAAAQSEEALRPVRFSVSCRPAVQPEFGRAVALLHHMTYPEARRLFERVAARDPRCAMAHWGIAMTLFQPLWPTRPSAEDLRHGWDEVVRARSLGTPTEPERLLVDGVAAFFEAPASGDYWQRIRRWEDAMARAHAAAPDHPEITAFYALAMLAGAPADTASHDRGARAAALLLTVYRRDPAHPGAQHYLVHANDAPGRERSAPEIVRGYARSAPRNPHALHMPTHIYTRLGDWDEVISGNRAAAEAALEHPAGERGEFVWDEYPHAIEYLVYAWLQKGADDSAAAALKKLQTTPRLQPTFKTAFHLASTRARDVLERKAWKEAAAIRPKEPADIAWERFAWPEAVSWFARGLGAAHSGEMPAGQEASVQLSDLERKAAGAGEALFTANIRMLRLELDAALAQAAGDGARAVALLNEAAALEHATPKHAVTPAPTIPATELLGDLLLEQNRPADALVAYRRSLELYPRRFNGLLGAARAARSTGDTATARRYYAELLTVASAAGRPVAVAEARSFTVR